MTDDDETGDVAGRVARRGDITAVSLDASKLGECADTAPAVDACIALMSAAQAACDALKLPAGRTIMLNGEGFTVTIETVDQTAGDSD